MRTLILLFFAASTAAQTSLHQRLADVAKEAQGKVYVACSLPGVKLDCDLGPYGRPPMQSTFKFPLALAVLHQVELGKLQLADQGACEHVIAAVAKAVYDEALAQQSQKTATARRP